MRYFQNKIPFLLKFKDSIKKVFFKAFFYNIKIELFYTALETDIRGRILAI